MKKYFILSMLIGAVLLGFTACGDDDDEPQPTAAQSMAGTYAGTDSVNVGGKWSYQASNSPRYTISANADGTINITIPERQYDNTQVGNIVAGSYTISNIKYDEVARHWARDYSGDNLQGHVMIAGSRMTIDNDYPFAEGSEIVIQKQTNGTIKIVNYTKYGKMPFQLNFYFTGK